jgi:hypothetical protein
VQSASEPLQEKPSPVWWTALRSRLAAEVETAPESQRRPT